METIIPYKSVVADSCAMRCLGLISALNPEASAVYARLLHQEVRHVCDDAHSASLRIVQLKQHQLSAWCARSDWRRIQQEHESAARALVKAGAETLLLDSSTMHLIAQQIEKTTDLPLLHMLRACEVALRESRPSCVGLLGTRCLEEEEMWRKWLRVHSGIDIALPPTADRKLVNEIMRHELACGRIKEASRVTVIRTMKALKRAGARAIVVVAPELLSIAFQSDTQLELHSAARLHARAAVKWSLASMPLRE